MEGKEEEKKERSHTILWTSFLKIIFNLLRVLGEAKNNNSVLGLPGGPVVRLHTFNAEGKRSIPGVAGWDPTWLLARKRKEKNPSSFISEESIEK